MYQPFPPPYFQILVGMLSQQTFPWTSDVIRNTQQRSVVGKEGPPHQYRHGSGYPLIWLIDPCTFCQDYFPFFVLSAMTAWISTTHKRLIFHQLWYFFTTRMALAFFLGGRGYFRFCWSGCFLRSTFVPEELIVDVRTTSHWTDLGLGLPPAVKDMSTVVYYKSEKEKDKNTSNVSTIGYAGNKTFLPFSFSPL